MSRHPQCLRVTRMISIRSDGGEIVETNYFDSKMADAGVLGLSVHKCCIRVLVPERSILILPDMIQGVQEAALILVAGLNANTEGIAFQLVMNDGSDQPWSFCGGVTSIIGGINIPPDSTFTAAVWTRIGGKLTKCWDGAGAVGMSEELPVELPLG